MQGGADSIPGQGARSCIPQLQSLHAATKSPRFTTKTQSSQTYTHSLKSERDAGEKVSHSGEVREILDQSLLALEVEEATSPGMLVASRSWKRQEESSSPYSLQKGMQPC